MSQSFFQDQTSQGIGLQLSKKQSQYDSVFYHHNSEPVFPFLQFKSWQALNGLLNHQKLLWGNLQKKESQKEIVIKTEEEINENENIWQMCDDLTSTSKKDGNEKCSLINLEIPGLEYVNLVPFTKALLKQGIIQSEEEKKAMELLQNQLKPLEPNDPLLEESLINDKMSRKKGFGFQDLERVKKVRKEKIFNAGRYSGVNEDCLAGGKGQRYLFGENNSHKRNQETGFGGYKMEESFDQESHLDANLLKARNSRESKAVTFNKEYLGYEYAQSFKKWPGQIRNSSNPFDIGANKMKRETCGGEFGENLDPRLSQKRQNQPALKNEFPIYKEEKRRMVNKEAEDKNEWTEEQVPRQSGIQKMRNQPIYQKPSNQRVQSLGPERYQFDKIDSNYQQLVNKNGQETPLYFNSEYFYETGPQERFYSREIISKNQFERKPTNKKVIDNFGNTRVFSQKNHAFFSSHDNFLQGPPF